MPSNKKRHSWREFEKFIVAMAKIFGIVIVVFFMGLVRVQWKSGKLYICHVLPMLLTLALTTMEGAHLHLLGYWLPNVFTAWKVSIMAQYHWTIHFVACLAIFNILSIVVWGIKPWKDKKCFQEAIDDLGFVTTTGKKPRVVSIVERQNGKKIVRIRSVGVGPEQYERRQSDLQSSIDWRIDKIERDEKNRYINIFLTEGALPELVDYTRVEEKVLRPYQFVVGESAAGTILAVLDELPHLLIAGVTGGGKSTFLNAMLLSLLKSPRLSVYGIDLKVVELAPYADIPGVHVDDTLDDAARTLESIHREMERRYRDILGAKGEAEN